MTYLHPSLKPPEPFPDPICPICGDDCIDETIQGLVYECWFCGYKWGTLKYEHLLSDN